MGGLPTQISLSKLFVGPCVSRPEVVNEVPDYAVALVFGVLCWGYVPPPPYNGVLDRQGTKLRSGEILSGLMQILFLSLIFPSSSSSSSSSFFILAFSDFPFGLFFIFLF